MSFRVAVLTISDSAALDPTTDRSGGYITQTLTSAYTVKTCEIVPDVKHLITEFVQKWSATAEVDLILTSGGTGFSPRDVTPEAILPLLEQQAPGFVHAILASSPRAILARPVAGIIKSTLVITLPGSINAVKECLAVILAGGALEHALRLLKGEDSRKLHSLSNEGLGEPAGERHHHHHSHEGHVAPKSRTLGGGNNALSVSKRPRVSLYPIVTLDEAYDLIFSTLLILPVETHAVDSNLRGYVLAEQVVSSNNIPPLPSSNVDGYAVHSLQKAGTYTVVHSLNHSIREPVPDGRIYRINTGAPLPMGTNAVIMVEDTQLHSEDGAVGEEKEVTTLTMVDAGENVRLPGSDIREGTITMEKGAIIGNTGGDIGALAFVGCRSVSVYRKPVVAILSTGNELLDLDQDTGTDGSWTGWDTNRPTLKGVLEARGYTVVDLGIIQDSMDAHEAALKEGLLKADIVLATGGSSMGTTDLLKPVLEQRLHGEIVFGRVKVKPGKPTIFAKVPCNDLTFKPLFGLPGNPASALVTFYLFFLPALRLLGGYSKDLCKLPYVKVKLADAMPLDPRPEFHRAQVWPDSFGVLTAHSTGSQRSSRATSLSGANAFIALPSKDSIASKQIPAGEMADAILIDF